MYSSTANLSRRGAAGRASPATRLDVPEGLGPQLSPRLGIGYTLARTGRQLRAAWGWGFKLPSLFALGDPLVGNPYLAPERSEGAEIGFTQPLWARRLEVSATAFWNRFEDLIDFSAEAFTLVNRSQVRTQGVEASVTLMPWSAGQIYGALTYLETDIRASQEPLRNRPWWAGGVGVHWQGKDVTFGARATWVGRRPDTDFLIPPSGRTSAGSSVNVDATVSVRLSRHLKAFLAVENLLDQAYDEVLGFPAPRITPRVGLEARF